MLKPFGSSVTELKIDWSEILHWIVSGFGPKKAGFFWHFAPIRTMLEARQKRERDRFLTVVCNDNPYEAVWQPEEGTCGQFATEGGN